MDYALRTHQLSKTYANGVIALKGVDLAIAQGDFYALLGPNGAGKSTVIGILCSLVNKTAGNVEIFGVDIDRDFARAKSFLGVVPQEFNFNIFETPLQIVRNQAGYYGIDRQNALTQAEKYLKLLGLWDKRAERAGELSGGFKRRLMIARALVHEPRLLILDEPTAGVDIEIRRSMWDFLRQINSAGTTIILTTHYLEEAESLCRNIGIINQGTLVENTSMRTLLRQLNVETFVLDLEQPLTVVPASLAHNAHMVDPTTLEIAVDRDDNLNHVYAMLSAADIKVRSMRNKANRLEQLFINLVGQAPGSSK
ncbi:MAG: ABC transporter ATP-binding protein [Acidiferrobacteraceae bacterium]|nr:ABC transporter ATP-binding protein [Acidiferrobacteraceae bacterium]MBT3769136.1 ABC transporter ATP-binding protein [Acidiferrobacteraceae bacterium]MBT4405576.1 ABC transporter ATP-binding protein [Acidiferrobacteraceae bacterium]MBT5622990.1 ABC transporter ATP-binding protein [Acidiferrobacteraceae bacterium]MBT6733097.1 ABC transporter ATP-binding protein [Acidiferrobacteraceae bacterium]